MVSRTLRAAAVSGAGPGAGPLQTRAPKQQGLL